MATNTKPAAKRKTAEGATARRRHQRREEIIGLIGFGAVMLFVFLMRNYAS